MSSLADNLKRIRKSKGLSQQELADKLNTSKQVISRYERGERDPKTDMLFKLSDALNVNPWDLMGWDYPVEDGHYIAPEWNEWKKNHSIAASDDDPWTLREELRRDPDRKALLKLARNGSAKDVRQAMALIDALRATNPDFYDGDDPA